MSLMDALIKASWPVPSNVRSYVTTRAGGVSHGSFASLNLALHVGDDEADVLENRQKLQMALGYHQAAWLEQTHSITVVQAEPSYVTQADASWTDKRGIASVVMTADCLPVLFCDKQGRYVAAAHAGWRGLLKGILEQTVHAIPVAPEQLVVWLGPAIGAACFEVGAEVRDAFVKYDANATIAFMDSSRPYHYLADIYQLAKLRLQALGIAITDIYGGDFCTMSDSRFFSYRQNSVTGRMATLIWLE